MRYIKFSYHGRAGMIIDVVIDTLGVAIGVLMVYFVIEILNRKKDTL